MKMTKEEIENHYDKFFGTGLWERDYKKHIVEFTRQCLATNYGSASVSKPCNHPKGAVIETLHYDRCTICGEKL